MFTKRNTSELQAKVAQIRRDAEERDAEQRAIRLGFPYSDIRHVPISIDALKLIPKEEARAAKVAALEIKLRAVAISAFNPSSPEAQAVFRALEAKHYTIRAFVASLSGLEEAWRFYEFIAPPGKEITGTLGIGKERLDELAKDKNNFQAVGARLTGMNFTKVSTTELFEMVLAGGLVTGASDIHFEANDKQVRVRLRIDGLLHDVMTTLPVKNYLNLVSRVKLLSGLKINIRDEPQDGRFTITLPDKKEIEIRVSLIPSEFGETIVMRILDPDALVTELADLGLRADDLTLIELELSKPNGMILNTGPTGSGKTTTLYAFLRYISKPEAKVITIEDPIEYRLPGIEQTQVDPEVDYTFASGLRSILRQDPNVILVGEIRDEETADIAVQASLTGHLVFSTLHTNDALGAIPRLVDLKIQPGALGPALNIIIAQRLVRKLCETCRKSTPFGVEETSKMQAFLGKLPLRVDRAPFEALLKEGKTGTYEAVGCDACNHFGYKGRIGVFEFLGASPELEEAILVSPSENTLRKISTAQGMVTMQQDGILKALQGITTLKEVERITGPITW